MKIGIDIDDTITDLSEIFFKYGKKYNKENNINFHIDKTQWDLNKAYGWDNNHYENFSKKYLKTLLNEAKPKENAVKIIQRLKEEGDKIIIITSRNSKELENPYEVTKKWLIKNNIYFDKLIVNSIRKENDCAINNIDLFIDDRLEYCKNVQDKLNIPVLMFDSIYNANDINPVIKRVFSWDEVYKEIHKIKNK